MYVGKSIMSVSILIIWKQSIEREESGLGDQVSFSYVFLDDLSAHLISEIQHPHHQYEEFGPYGLAVISKCLDREQLHQRQFQYKILGLLPKFPIQWKKRKDGAFMFNKHFCRFSVEPGFGGIVPSHSPTAPLTFLASSSSIYQVS